jgi:AraC family transcriptional regulator of adaptative response/methylated-DNA-[protein]-cysteine methyltransferase
MTTSPLRSVPDTAWRAITARDHGHDGRFVYAVRTTGVFCRPGCASRRPLRRNVELFATAADALASGYRPCKRCEPLAVERSPERIVGRAVAMLERHANQPVTLTALGRECGMSASRLQRVFTSAVGMSPRRYHEAMRARALRGALRSGRPVSRAIAEAGYGSTSRVHERSAALLGMTPSAYASRGVSMDIRYEAATTHLGTVLVAYTERGVCFVSLGDSPSVVEAELRREFPQATVTRARDRRDWVRAVVTAVQTATPCDVPIDVAGTELQRLVWDELRRIPRGETRSYAQVAAAIGRPAAIRAVARACASNRIAVVIPCHRVIRGDGSLAGYRWGLERKRALLATEAG